MWNPSGFYALDRLLNDTKTHSDYFVTNYIIPFEQTIFPRGRALHQKRLVVHLENCSIHTNRASRDWLEEHDIRRMTHPSDLFDLTPITFIYFLHWTRNSNGLRWLTRTSFLTPCKRFWGVSIKKSSKQSGVHWIRNDATVLNSWIGLSSASSSFVSRLLVAVHDFGIQGNFVAEEQASSAHRFLTHRTISCPVDRSIERNWITTRCSCLISSAIIRAHGLLDLHMAVTWSEKLWQFRP
jgi:hypothetical protein